MFKANKPIKARKVNIYSQKRSIMPPTETIYIFKPSIVRMVGDKLCKYLWKEAWTKKGADYERFLDIVFAILRSIRRDALVFYQKAEPCHVELYLDTMFKELLEVPKKDFNSPFVERQVSAKHDYFERCYKLRTMIQNYNWCYKSLDEDARLFMKLREKYKLYYDDFKLFKDKSLAQKCIVCNMPCVYKPVNVCSYCDNFDRLEMYLKIANCFHVMGSYMMFFFYLPDMAFQYLMDNWEKLSVVFSRSIECTPIELYQNEVYLQTFRPTVKVLEETIEEKEKTDGMLALINKIFADEKNKMKEENEKKLKDLLEKNKKMKKEAKKKEKKPKEDDDDFEIGINLPDPAELDDEIERAAYLKSLSAHFDPKKKMEDMGDKEFQ